MHHKLEELLDQYLKASGLEKEPQSPLFPASIGKTGELSRRPLVRTDAADMLKRRLKQAGLPARHSSKAKFKRFSTRSRHPRTPASGIALCWGLWPTLSPGLAPS